MIFFSSLVLCVTTGFSLSQYNLIFLLTVPCFIKVSNSDAVFVCDCVTVTANKSAVDEMFVKLYWTEMFVKLYWTKLSMT